MSASWVLFCAGCGSQAHSGGVVRDPCAPVVLMPDPGTSQPELDSIGDALAMWRGVANLSLSLGTEVSAQPVAVRFEKAALASYGFYDDTRAVIYINRGLADRHERAVTIAHELGHALALAHVALDERSSVMNQQNLSIEPTAADAAELAHHWGECEPPSGP